MSACRRVARLGVASIVFGWVGAATCAGSTLAQTQLKGLTAVNVGVRVSPEVGEDAGDLEDFARKVVEKALGGAGIQLVAKTGEWFKVDVKAVRLTCADGGNARVVLFISARLIEHVGLKRDPSKDVPGGGAITWWREGMKACSSGDLRKAIGDSVDYFVTSFTDEWQIENRAKGN
jgi:hypothetical protein